MQAGFCFKSGAALTGEVVEFISSASADGISYAILSGDTLDRTIIKEKPSFMPFYENYTKRLKSNISKKLLKYLAMHNKYLQKVVFQLAIGSI